MKKSGIKRTFVTGIVIALPLLITFWVVQLIFGSIDAAVTPMLAHVCRFLGLEAWFKTSWLSYVGPLLSVALSLGVIYVLGLVGGNVLGRQLLQSLDRLLMHVPFVRGIYSATRQFVDTFSTGEKASQRRVVLVQYPRLGLWTLGLLTNNVGGEIARHSPAPLVCVFIPTTPNPTSGFLLFVPVEEAHPLAMSVDDALKMIVSGGVLLPPAAA